MRDASKELQDGNLGSILHHDEKKFLVLFNESKLRCLHLLPVLISYDGYLVNNNYIKTKECPHKLTSSIKDKKEPDEC